MSKKEIGVYFCPKCRSTNVGYIFKFGNLFGMLPYLQCKDCKFKSQMFPKGFVKKNKLENKSNNGK